MPLLVLLAAPPATEAAQRGPDHDDDEGEEAPLCVTARPPQRSLPSGAAPQLTVCASASAPAAVWLSDATAGQVCHFRHAIIDFTSGRAPRNGFSRKAADRST